MYITNEIEFLDRIKIIIKKLAKDSGAAFARKIGVNERYVQRYIKEGRGDWFISYSKDICDAFPMLSEKWLYTGEGEMLVPVRPNPIRSVVNRRDELVGDNLWVFFDKKRLNLEDVKRACQFDDTFNQVMESSRYPTFTEVEILHEKYGLNPIHLFCSDAEDIKNYPVANTIEKLKEELRQAEKENKLLSSRLMDALEENSELNKELRNARAATEQVHNVVKNENVVFGQIYAKNTKESLPE